MIKENKILSIAEAKEYVKGSEKKEEVIKFIKDFTKLSAKDALEIRKSLEEMNLMKIKLEHIAKVIDIMPENKEELNKIFVNVSLSEDETAKILDKIKKFK